MSFTYDVTTDVGKVRLLCTDTDASNPLFQDEEISAVLDLEGNVIRYAAAQLVECIAASEVLVQKRIKNLDLETNGPEESKELRELAKQLRANEEAQAAFDIAEVIEDPFSARERIYKQFLRLRQ